MLDITNKKIDDLINKINEKLAIKELAIFEIFLNEFLKIENGKINKKMFFEKMDEKLKDLNDFQILSLKNAFDEFVVLTKQSEYNFLQEKELKKILSKVQEEQAIKKFDYFFKEKIKGKMERQNTKDFFIKNVEEATKNVVSGLSSYSKEIQKVTDKLIESGINTLTEDKRNINIFSKTRQDVLNTYNQFVNEVALQNEKEINSGIFEISFHFPYAPDHPFGGKRYKINNSVKADLQTEKEIFKHSDLSRQNCRHYIFPVFAESTPVYTTKALKTFEKENKKEYNFNETNYTLYNLTQKMRNIELKLIKENQKLILYKQINNVEGVQLVNSKIKSLNASYNKILKVNYNLKDFGHRIKMTTKK